MVPFSDRDLKAAKKLVEEGRVIDLFFSEGTYQVEISLSNGESIWPFLQLSDQAEVINAFCPCDEVEKEGRCLHLATAYLAIMQEEPLHVRFRSSLWNQIALIGVDRHGYDPKCLQKVGKRFEAHSKEGVPLFWITLKTGEARGKWETIVANRPLETEATSLKFSHLSQEELHLWREGRPSPRLRYELSFWADLAKWWMSMQESKLPYQIQFSLEHPPGSIEVAFDAISIGCHIDRENWPALIPALSTVDSPLPVHLHPVGKIVRIDFLEDRGSLLLSFSGEKTAPSTTSEEGAIPIDGWLYVPNRGFYPRQVDPLLEKREIFPEEVDLFLQRYHRLVHKTLHNVVLHLDSQPARYLLSFDKEHTLHVETYVSAPGDLQQRGAHFFGEWVFLPQLGFIHLTGQQFHRPEVLIGRGGISEFIKRHRVWLQNFDGFQTHVCGVESHLGYLLKEGDSLFFYTRLDFAEEGEEIVDFGDWIYVPKRGFYAKVAARYGRHVQPNVEVPSAQIAHFIETYGEELEGIRGFFSTNCPIEKTGVSIQFNVDHLIVIVPQYFFKEGYDSNRVKLFGDYTYVAGEGFASIPHELRLPEAYQKEKIVQAHTESYFVGYELDLLYPHLIQIDPKLRRPSFMQLRLTNLRLKAAGQWIVDLTYETDVGEISPYEIWQALSEGKAYLFSSAGLILLRSRRFDWLRLKKKKGWIGKGKSIKLTTLELLRLSAFDELLEPVGESKKVREARGVFRAFADLKAPSMIDIQGLKSSLRPYQQTGVSWLWFLYSFGLSGLLCDEMGLGKTHQAMALIAGIGNAKKGENPLFLVVCPTSVIYHWEKLIATFLPHIKTYLFHGVGRRLEEFTSGKYDLLLTSYGIVRSEQKALEQIAFDLAVFDELQVAKNEKSITHKALRALSAYMRLGLSGTPMENRLSELKALFDLVIPGYLPSASAFRETFITPIEKWQDGGKRLLLKKLIHPFLLRRKKGEVLRELPEKIEEVVFCDLSEEQRALYQDIVAKEQAPLLREFENGRKQVPIGHVFALLSKLKQVCDHPSLITKKPEEYKKHASGKWDLFLELLQETRDSGQKLVVFSQYLDMLDIIAMHLEEHHIGFAQIRGATIDRKAELDRFAEDPHCVVFLGSLQAAGVGIDLVAASVVIHYDRWWNPAKEDQATDRVHRLGQKRGVQVFKFVTKDTVEEHIHRLIESKISLTSGVIGFDDQDQIKGLDRKELLNLLRLIGSVESGKEAYPS